MSAFQIINLTPAAEEQLTHILSDAQDAPLGLRISVKNGGCAGMEYDMSLVYADTGEDDIVETPGGKIYVDRRAILFLLGAEVDFEITKLRSGFVFRNPNQQSACGCGESVQLVAADPSKLPQ